VAFLEFAFEGTAGEATLAAVFRRARLKAKEAISYSKATFFDDSRAEQEFRSW